MKDNKQINLHADVLYLYYDTYIIYIYMVCIDDEEKAMVQGTENRKVGEEDHFT